MNSEEFTLYAEDFFGRMRQNLDLKATGDYATGEDRLFNFHAAGTILGSPAKACFAYATKHFLSIAKLLDDGKEISRELALEKLGDLATYMVLLYAVLMEDNEKAQEYFYSTND